MSVELSKEQQMFVDLALAGNNILVEACIGSGKVDIEVEPISDYSR